MDDELMTTKETALLFKVDVQTIRRWAKTGALPVINLETNGVPKYRFRKSDIMNKLNKYEKI